MEFPLIHFNVLTEGFSEHIGTISEDSTICTMAAFVQQKKHAEFHFPFFPGALKFSAAYLRC